MPDTDNPRVDPSRAGQPQVGLASWLGGGSVFVVLLAVATIAIACGILLNRQIQQQALVRTQLAVATARELLRRAGEDALSDARVLAEGPTLIRLAENPTSGGLEPFLRRYNESTGIDVSALLKGDKAVAQSGTPETPIDWAEIATAVQEQGERFLLAPKQGGYILWGAAALIPGTDIRAVTLKLTSPTELASLGQQVGAQLSAVNFATYHAPPDDPMTPLHTQALTTPGGVAAGRLPKRGDFAATTVIAAQTGEVVGLLDARLGSSEFAAATRNFEWILATVAVVVAGIAGLLGVLYGRWLAQPVVALRELADRMGRGDFMAAIPAVAPLEVGALGRSMDEMRRNMVNLTETLRQREAEAQTVLSGVVEGVYAVDMDRRIRYANAQVARLLDLPETEIVGRFCGDVLQPRPLNNGERPCERNCPILAARHSPQSSARELLCLRNGVIRSTIVQSAPPVHGVQVQILRDETDLEAARRARDSVLGNISHEFRTPLAAQLASIELLRDGLRDMPPEAQQELLSNVERGVLRLMRLIDNLLESVRLEAGQSSIRLQPVDLLDVVTDSRDLIAPLFRQRQLSVSIDEASIGAIVRGDAQRLGQVFVNLLANAAKFAPEGSIIRVGGQRLGLTVEVWVEDEGPGVPEGSSGAIFQRFQRGADSEPDAPGLGLGLWIVKSIIDRHGGSVRLERTPAQRTRFILSLPQEREDCS